MLNSLRQFALILAVAILVCVTIPVPAAAQSRHTFTINNNSGIDIYQVRMSSVRDPDWERDLLGHQVLISGNSFTVTGITRGYYDILLVDEDGDECELHQVWVYDDMTWNLTTVGLVGCELH